MTKQKGKKNILYRIFIQDGYTKLVALAFSCVIFFMVRENISEKEVFHATITTEATKTGQMAVAKVDPPDVEITLRGTAEQLRNIREDKLTLKVNPGTETLNGFETVKLLPKNVDGRGQARVDSISPATVKLEYSVEGEVSLPVARPILQGKPLLGTADIVWPETNVFVRGPLSRLNSLKDNAVELMTEPIDVEGRIQNFFRKVRILSPSDIGNLKITPSEIDVQVIVKVETETRVYEHIPVQLTTVTGGGVLLTSDPATVTVRIVGTSERLDAITPENITVLADCREVAAESTNQIRRSLHVYLPATSQGIEVLKPIADPSEITVKVTRLHTPEPPLVEPSVRVESPAAAVGPFLPADERSRIQTNGVEKAASSAAQKPSGETHKTHEITK